MAPKKVNKWWEDVLLASSLFSQRECERKRRRVNIDRERRMKEILAGRR